MKHRQGLSSVVVFRQEGRNRRLGNTLSWITHAYDWCQRHEFGFCFPAAGRTLGQLIDASSPLFQGCAQEFGKGNDAPETSGNALNLAQRVIDSAVEAVKDASKSGGVQRMVSVSPGELGFVGQESDLTWDDPDLAGFVRSHSIVVIDEPLQIRRKAPCPAKEEREWLSPGPAVTATLGALAAAPRPLIGVHIRQTDYRHWRGGEHFRDNGYYNELVAELRAQIDGTLLVACDGEFELSSGNRGPDVTLTSTLLGSDEVIRDFVALSACDVLAGPISTFTLQSRRMARVWHERTIPIVPIRPGASPGQTARDVLDSLRGT